MNRRVGLGLGLGIGVLAEDPVLPVGRVCAPPDDAQDVIGDGEESKLGVDA